MTLPRRVVVTGLGVVSPLGIGVGVAWPNLKEGKSGICRINEKRMGSNVQSWKSLPSQVAAFVPHGHEVGSFDSTLFDSTQNKVMPLGMKYASMAADEALIDAGWTPNSGEDKQRSGACIGMAMADDEYISDCHKLVQEGQFKKLGPFYVPRVLTNLVAGHISIKHNLQGPNQSVATACATGSHAIGDGYRSILLNQADVMVCGSTEACITPLNIAGFCRMRALSSKFNDEPQKASRPFSADRDGFVIGEGAGILVLEELNHALKRNAKIYAEVVGYGMSGDADHITAGRKDGEGALLAMRNSFSSIGLDQIQDLWCINAHATSTPLGDLAEVTALNKLVSTVANNPSKPWVVSNKGFIGHLLGAAGSVESIFAVLSLKESFIPSNANLSNVADCDSDNLTIVRDKCVIDVKKDIKQRRRLVLKNSFGFGGTNASLLFREWNEDAIHEK